MSLFSAIKMMLTLRCDESSHLLSDALDRPLTLPERLALALHLAVCRNCRRFRRRLRLLAEAMRRMGSAEEPSPPAETESLSPEARRRIEEALRQE